MVKTVLEILERNDISALGEVLSGAGSRASAKIAFLGEFSSGKTSLINKLIGTNLPVSTVPTTKNICLIEPTDEIEDGKLHYYAQEPNGEAVEIDALRFNELVLSNDETVDLVIKSRPSAYLPNGTVLVDTPGKGSLSAESEITTAYLSQVDAVVFCISATDGTIHDKALKFLSSPILARIQSRMVFVLTMADLVNSAKEIGVIRDKLIATLHEQATAGRFSFTDIDDRVVAVSIKDDDTNLQDILLPVLNKMIFCKIDVMQKEREDIIGEMVARDAADVLSKRLESMTLDDVQLIKRKEEAEADIQVAYNELKDATCRFDEFRMELPTRIENAFDGHIGELITANDAEKRQLKAKSLADSIEKTIKHLSKVKLGTESLTGDNSWKKKIELMMPELLARIDRTARGVADLAFVALSSGLAAIVPEGAVAAEGAARGAATVATKTASEKLAPKACNEIADVAKKTFVRVPKNVADAAKKTTETAKTAETVKDASKTMVVLGKAAQILSQVLDSINPASYIADWVTPSLKERAMNQYKKDVVSQADRIADLMWEDYEALVINPTKKVIELKKKELFSLSNQIDLMRQEYLDHKDEIRADIEMLRGFCKN